MKPNIKIICILAFIAIIGVANSCTYNELPPKTENASTNYILPKGEIPTAEEKAELQRIRAEYNNSIK